MEQQHGRGLDALVKFSQQTRAWRSKAMREFEAASAEARDIAWAIQHSVAELALGLSGQNWAHVANAKYYVGLTVSYIRTQQSVVEMALASEVSDGATLLRKQLELVARLRELDITNDATALLGKVPNLRHLKTPANKLYGTYSEIAHVSVVKIFDLLGEGDGENIGFTSLYPKFSSNSHVLLHNAALIHIEFLDWAVPSP